MADVEPQSLEAEESVLGAMLLNANAIAAVSDILEPQDFYRESHGRIYRVAVDMYAAGDPVDAVTLIDTLGRRGDLEGVGGKTRIHELARLVPATANAKHYAGIVKETAQRRSFITAGHHIAQLGWNGGEDLQDQAEGIVLALAPRHTEHETVYTAPQLANGFREKLERAKIIDTSGVPAPWDFLGRLKGSRLYVLAGYTGDGKSAAGVQFLSHACQDGARVCLASNEMSAADLTDRLVSTFGVPHHQCASGQVDSRYRPIAESALSQIEGWDFTIVDDEALDLPTLRRHVRIQQPDLLIVDHLHRFHWKERRELELVIRGITNLAREFDIPILLLAQLRRASSEWREPFPRPSLSQLKETSMLEQEAWGVWFIWRKRDEFHQPGTETELLVAKNRGGMLDYKRLEFVPEHVRFDFSSAKNLGDFS